MQGIRSQLHGGNFQGDEGTQGRSQRVRVGGPRRRTNHRKVLRGGTFRRGEKGRHLQGGENTPEKERHGTGEVVGVRQSVLGTVGKHPERSSFLTAVVRKKHNKNMGFEKFSKSYFGSNLEKARRNYEVGVAREKL